MSRIGKSAGAMPGGVVGHRSKAPCCRSRVPRGRSACRCSTTSATSIGDGEIRGQAGQRDQARALLLGHAADAGPEPRHRRHRRLHQGARNHRRRLSRRRPRARICASSSATATTSISRFPKASKSRLPTRIRSRSAASTSRRSARSRPKSAAGASPSRTRARASNIAASISSAKKARRSKPWPFSPSSIAAAAGSAPRSQPRASGKPRLSVHRSGRHIYAQVIDDAAGKTLASASTLDKDFKGKTGATRDGAAAVGKALAERAKKAGVSQGRVRSRRLPFPWPRKGPRRRCPRRRTGVLNG